MTLYAEKSRKKEKGKNLVGSTTTSWAGGNSKRPNYNALRSMRRANGI